MPSSLRLHFALVSFVLLTLSHRVAAFPGPRGYSAFISDALSNKFWNQCSGEGEACYEDRDCCEDFRCVTSNLPRGPKMVCMDVPSRIYRHLEKSGEKTDNSKTEAKYTKTYGEECEQSTECMKTLCCQRVHLFRIGPVQSCEFEESYSKCL